MGTSLLMPNGDEVASMRPPQKAGGNGEYHTRGDAGGGAPGFNEAPAKGGGEWESHARGGAALQELQ